MRKEKKDFMENENKEKEMDNRINIERKGKEKPEEKKETETQVTEEAAEQLVIDAKQINELTEKVLNLEKENTELKDRLLRRVAEFDNFKRRTENEQMNLLKYSAESFILKVLPIYDDFERSLSHIKETDNIESIKEGLQLVLNKFSKILEEQGVKKIDSIGQPFDVNYHEALMQRTVQNAAPHTVIDEVESGYIYKDKVIRHSKVIVSDDNSTDALQNSNTDQKEN